MNTFDSIRAVLYKKEHLKHQIAGRIMESSSERGVRTIEILNDEDFRTIISNMKDHFKSKEVLILDEFMGRKFQKCPGSKNVICCNYYLLNTCFNCLYNCTYCFLNSYLNSYGITQFVNLEDLGELIESHARSVNRIVRVGTGEFTDSMMFDGVTLISHDLIASTASIKNVFLEFKTKSSDIEHLKNISDKGNTVLAWSMNTQRNIDLYEDGTSNIMERIGAAARAQKWGYKTAFHFDPIIRYDDFIKEYFSLIEHMAEKLDPAKTAWISLGCFRYSPGFKDIIKYSFPQEKLTVEEMFPGKDGKYRYLYRERADIFRKFRDRLETHFPGVFIYLCMEDSDMWSDVFGRNYTSSEDLEYDFNIYLYKKFMK